jgi:hypothetical protein
VLQSGIPDRREVAMALLSVWIRFDPGPISSPADGQGKVSERRWSGGSCDASRYLRARRSGAPDLAATVASLLPRIQLLHTPILLGDTGVSVPRYAGTAADITILGHRCSTSTGLGLRREGWRVCGALPVARSCPEMLSTGSDRHCSLRVSKPHSWESLATERRTG